MKPIPLHIITLAAVALCSASCKDLTHVQTGYIADRDDCQSRAYYGINSYTAGTNSISPKDKNNMQTQLFCECMKDHEWSVSGCKYPNKDVAKATPEQQPTIVVVQAPPAAAVTAPVVEPPACPAPQGKKPKKRKLDGTCPAPEEYSQTELDNVLNKQ